MESLITTWSPSTQTNSPHSGAQVVTSSSNNIFLLGGHCNDNGAASSPSLYAKVSAPATKDSPPTFTIPEMRDDIPCNRIGCSAAIVEDKIYLFGGETITYNAKTNGKLLGDLYVGDVVGQTITWSRKTAEDALEEAAGASTTAPPTNDGGEAAAPVSVGSKKLIWPASRVYHKSIAALTKSGEPAVYICGGETKLNPTNKNTTPKDSQILYNPKTLKFSEVRTTGKSPFPLSRFSLTAPSASPAPSPNAVLFGGFNPTNAAFSSSISIIDFQTMSWSSPKATGVAPSPRCFHSSIAVLTPFAVANSGGMKLSASTASIAASEASAGGGDGTAPVPVPTQKKGSGLWRTALSGENEEEETEISIVVFGGIGEGGLSSSETYSFDRSGAWQVLDIASGEPPEGRFNHAAFNGGDNKQTFVMGGANVTDGLQLDLWTAKPPEEAVVEVTPREPGYEEKQFDDGFYKGIVIDGFREGEGSMEYTDGRFYEGKWKQNNWDGRGKLTLVDKTTYEGEFNEGKINGTGSIVYGSPNADDRNSIVRYAGDFVGDKPNGTGKGVFVDGFEFQGEFLDGLAHGKGTLSYPDGGGSVEGTFANGDLVRGTEKLANGDTYTGKFSGRNTKFGDGIYIYPDGSTYEGSFKSGRRNGFGKFTDGTTRVSYVGKWVGDKRCGNGTETWPAGHKFVGLYGGDKKVEGSYTNVVTGEVSTGKWSEISDLISQ